MLIWAPQLWPQTAADWYVKYEQQFWQQGRLFAGFREFPRGIDVGWFNMSDVDAGPVIGGYGVAASAFGVGAARAMGRLDHARQLTAQTLLASWPLPDGTLLAPRVLSMISDAPYLGEAATLFALTRRPVMPPQQEGSTRLPAIVPLGILAFFALGAYEVIAAIRKLKWWRSGGRERKVPAPRFQACLWLALLGCAGIAGFTLGVKFSLVLLLAALILPLRRTRPAGAKQPPQP